jgi:hypothetical protein
MYIHSSQNCTMSKTPIFYSKEDYARVWYFFFFNLWKYFFLSFKNKSHYCSCESKYHTFTTTTGATKRMPYYLSSILKLYTFIPRKMYIDYILILYVLNWFLVCMIVWNLTLFFQAAKNGLCFVEFQVSISNVGFRDNVSLTRHDVNDTIFVT